MKSTTSLIIIAILISIPFVSCKKATFNHSEDIHYTACTYCEIVDSIEGIYVGYLYEFTPGIISPLDTIMDTLITLNVTRNFDYTGHIIDSTVCQFDLTYFLANPIRIFDNSGGFSPTGNDPNYNTKRFRYNESNNTFILELVKTQTFVGPGLNTVTQPILSFTGVRQ